MEPPPFGGTQRNNAAPASGGGRGKVCDRLRAHNPERFRNCRYAASTLLAENAGECGHCFLLAGCLTTPPCRPALFPTRGCRHDSRPRRVGVPTGSRIERDFSTGALVSCPGLGSAVRCLARRGTVLVYHGLLARRPDRRGGNHERGKYRLPNAPPPFADGSLGIGTWNIRWVRWGQAPGLGVHAYRRVRGSWRRFMGGDRHAGTGTQARVHGDRHAGTQGSWWWVGTGTQARSVG